MWLPCDCKTSQRTALSWLGGLGWFQKCNLLVFVVSSQRAGVRRTLISGLQKGPAERGHVKKRQKSSQSVKNFFDTFRQSSRRAQNVKNRQKVSRICSTLFDNFRAAPVFRPLLGGSDVRECDEKSLAIAIRVATSSTKNVPIAV